MTTADGSRTELVDRLDLVDYRRRVASLYAEVRNRGVGPDSWRWWREARADLLLSHPQSPVLSGGFAEDALQYFEYDATWSVTGEVVPASEGATDFALDEQSKFLNIGTVVFERENVEHWLALFWLAAYGGGLFLPFRDATNNISTYGAGRYLLDGAKSADLGKAASGQLLLDFNFSYHPSCMWDPQWMCPLAPATNVLQAEVTAGELQPEASKS